jgi:2-polyprenyl-6-methoxyphenol hydroxylase-like FAD-dependent oxidoreductase
MQQNTSPRALRIVIAGGGPAGALAALYCGQAGYSVQVFEARPKLQLPSDWANNTRTYNTAVFERGQAALRGAGIDLFSSQQSDVAVLVAGAAQHSQTGARETPPLMGKYVSIDRGELAQRLLDTAAALPNVTVQYQHKLVSVDLQQRIATFAVTTAGAVGTEEVTQVNKLPVNNDIHIRDASILSERRRAASIHTKCSRGSR